MYHYSTGGVFRQINAYIKQRRLLVKHIIDMPAPSGGLPSWNGFTPTNWNGATALTNINGVT